MSSINIFHSKFGNLRQRIPFMRRQISQVARFHQAFKISNENKPKARVGKEVYQLRYNLMKEENEEYLKAAQQGDLAEIADALGDMIYILCGTILKHGLQHIIEEVFEEIQRSNMSKLNSRGKPIYRKDGKVMKSELYIRPDIKSILERHILELRS